MFDVNRQADYMAFISYRHADNNFENSQWANWLHHQLEVYEIPAELIGTENARGEVIPAQIYPVFRDEVSLPADADLSSAITTALDQSRFLVVLCSPRAIRSQYLSDEIIHFKASGKSDKVIAALLLGEPNASIDPAKEEDPEDVRTMECFPESLQFEVDSKGTLQRTQRSEPLAADFRLPDGGKGLTNPGVYKQKLLESGHSSREAQSLMLAYEEKLSTAKLKIIAGILGVRLDSLMERDKVHQLNRERERTSRAWKIGGGLAALSLVATAGGLIASWQYNQANDARILAEEQRSRAENLLSITRSNLTFMNFDLQEVLESHVPFGPRVEISQQIDAIVDTLEANGGPEDTRNIAIAKIQRAELVLKSATQDPELVRLLLSEVNESVQNLVELDPGNTQFPLDVPVTYEKLGDIELQLGNPDKALGYYNKYLEASLKLVELDPGNTKFQREVVVSNAKIGDLYISKDNNAEALSHYRAARIQVLEMEKSGTLAPEDDWMPQDLDERIESLQEE